MGKRINKEFYLVFFILILVNPGCNKIIYTVPVWNVPADLEQYILFKPGSYWVFKDSLTGKTDSDYVTTAQLDTIIINNDGNYFYLEKGSNVFQSLNVSFNYNNVTPQGYDCSTYNDSGKVANPIIVYSNGATPILFYPFNKPFLSLPYGITFDTIKLQKLSNYSVNGFTFPEVLRFEQTKDFYNNYHAHHTCRYYAGNVGLIQYQILDSTVNYKLVSYHIK